MEYRCLTNDGTELEAWATLCAQCFAEKPRPPSASYFLSHVTNDPHASPSDIFVAIDPSNNGPQHFVSSVRVFHRNLFSTKAFGIGEVCTLKEYRRRGISEALLRFVINKMTSLDDRQQYCFFLHAAEWVRPLYWKIGFHNANLVWTKIPCCPSVFPSSSSSIRCVMVPIIDHVEQLCALSNNFNQHYHGPLHRTHDYVRRWISNEANTTGNVMVLMQQETNNSDVVFLGYICLKEYPSKGDFQLRDFGAHDALSGLQFQYLLREAVHAMAPDSTVSYEVNVPMPIAQKYVMGDGNDQHQWSITTTTTVDDGWMWMEKQREDMITTIDTESVSLQKAKNMDLYWPIDNF